MISITPEYYSPEDYFRKHETSGNMQQICIAKTIKRALEIIPLMESAYPDLKADVEIRIFDSKNKVAQSSPYSIIISTGMVSHCIAAPCIPVENISIAMEVLGFEYDSLATLSVSWIIAHEYFHIARKHNEVAAEAKTLKYRPYNNSIDNALEHDADLLAVSAIYRFMQHKLSKILHDMEIRRLTAYHIFFSLRTLKQESDDDIHSPMPERIYHLIQKLIQLTQNRTEMVSISGLTEHSVERVQPILTVFIECEKHFNLTDGKASELIKLLNETKPGSRIFQITESWQWISPLVEKITGTRADNRSVKKIGKTATCIFCKSTKLTEVSVIPSWIVKKLDIKPGTQSLTNGALGLTLDDGTVIVNPALPYIRESKLGSENISRVCIKCTEEWLDPLNNYLKPIIENMIDGDFINLTKKDSKRLTLQICAMAVLHEYTDPQPHNRIIPNDFKRSIRKNIVPTGVNLVIRAIEKNSECRVRHHHCGISGAPIHVIFNLRLGSFFAQLIIQFANNYPLYFPKEQHYVAFPYSHASDFAEIQKMHPDETAEAYDNLHHLMHQWWITIMYKALDNGPS